MYLSYSNHVNNNTNNNNNNVCVNIEAIVYKLVLYNTCAVLIILPRLTGLAHLKSFTWELYTLASRDLGSSRWDLGQAD